MCKLINQGTNIPITITFGEDMTTYPKLVASLWQQNKLLKQWNKDDMELLGDTVSLPLNEDETRTWTKGKYELNVKGLNSLNQVIFWQEAEITVDARKDKDIDLVT